MPQKGRVKTISQLTKELDRVFSLWVRLSNADRDGTCACFTCNKRFYWKKIHAGHYLSRFYKATRWDPRNVKPQCFMCNIHRRGDPVVFREKLVAYYGEKKVKNEIEAARHTLFKIDRTVLEEKIKHYTNLTNGLAAKQ